MRSRFVYHTLSEGGYGRIYDVPSVKLETLCERMKAEFSTERILVYGNGKKTVKRIASFCGAGADDESLAFAVGVCRS